MKTFSLDSQQFRKTGTSSTSTMFHCYTKICNTVILYKRYPHIQESWLHTSTQRLAILTEAFHGIVQCKTKYKRFSSNTSITFMKYSLSYMFRPQLGPKHVAEWILHKGYRCVRRKTFVLCFNMEHIGTNKVKFTQCLEENFRVIYLKLSCKSFF